MSMTNYEHYKNLWEAVKPIRGRADDIRPIGERRRDYEQVTRNQLASGKYSYCARLYGTDCVEYLPSGNIILRTGGWETPSTAEFINEHSPFLAFKQNKKVWIRTKGMMYPVGKELILRPDSNGHYDPVNSVLIQKRAVNRDKAKAARAPMKPFLDWARAFMKMSDGWVMHATRVEVFGTSEKQIDGIEYPRWVFDPNATYEKICNAKPEDYVALLCALTREKYDAYERRLAGAHSWELIIPGHTPRMVTNEFYDMRFDPEHIKKQAYMVCSESVDYMDVKEVKPTHRTMSNVV